MEKVGEELYAGDDDLSEWARKRGEDFFRPTDKAALPVLAQVSDWASAQDYSTAAVNIFLQVADYYLVVQALAGGHTVITHEVPSASIQRIKIPDACISLGIKCLTPFEMLRRERARFILGGER